jgi:DNA-binding CsgD family transcriptional regulator
VQALTTYGLGKGLVVPIGRPANIPACVWLAGSDPALDDDATRAVQLIALFAASKAYALIRPPNVSAPAGRLTPREREVLRWICAGKTSWEIAAISALSERAINKIVGEAMIKLKAVTRTQAVVNAIRLGEIEL